jgi:hypothetical protein
LSRWRVLGRAVTKNRLLTCAIVLALLLLAERVMANRYRLGLQWGPDKRIELAPAPASSASFP